MTKNVFKNIRSLSTVLIIKEAKNRGIKVKHINDYQLEMAFLEMSYKNHLEYIIGQKSSKTSVTASEAVENKVLTKSLLDRQKVSTAEGKLFNKNDNVDKIYEFAKQIGYPVVVKKVDGAHGDLVFLGINNKNQCSKMIKEVLRENYYVLIEKEFKGKEFRLIATRTKFVAAVYREPANVIGDGIHSISQLIKIKNSSSMRGEKLEKSLKKINIDKDLKQKLFEQNLKMSSIISKEKKIYLRNTSNLSTGGDSIDVTDRVHPEIKKIVVRAVRAIPGLAYAGVDFMTNKDISEKPTKNSYIIIEINSSPMISMHHLPYKGEQRDVAKEIIDILFPETKAK